MQIANDDYAALDLLAQGDFAADLVVVDAPLRTDGGMRFLMALRATPEFCRVPVLTVTDSLVDI